MEKFETHDGSLKYSDFSMFGVVLQNIGSI